MDTKKFNLILETAETLFNRFGIQKTTVDEIAAAARVAKGTIYNNFGSKEGVLTELLGKKSAEFEESMDKVFSSLKDPITRMKMLLLERIKIIKNTPFLRDRILKTDERHFRFLFRNLDSLLQRFIERILEMDHDRVFTAEEKTRIGSTILFTLKGIEDHIKDQAGNTSLKKIDRDLDFLINLIFRPQYNE